MGSDLRYNLINSFRTVDAWRANIVFNMMGSITPGFKKRDISLGIRTGDQMLAQGEPGTTSYGSRAAAMASNSELIVQGYRIAPTGVKPTREQGSAASPTHLSVIGDGFFAVAESLSAGARVFYTRNGSFHWQQTGEVDVGGTKVPRYNLVNDQGLFVLRKQDVSFDTTTGKTSLKLDTAQIQADPPGMVLSKGVPGQRDGLFSDQSQIVPGRIRGLLGEHVQGAITGIDDATLQTFYTDSRDHDSDLAIVKIPAASSLVTSSYGGEIYEAPLDARRGIVVDSLRNWFLVERGNAPQVLPTSLEYMDQRGTLDQLNIENETANFVYKNLSSFLQDYNKSIDDLLSIVR